MARKAGNGRLSRIGFTEPRQTLARPRNVYELPESPEKRPFQLLGRVNQEPLKVVRNKAKAKEVDASVGSEASPELGEVVGTEGIVDRNVSEGPSPRHNEEQIDNVGEGDAVQDLIVPSSPPRIVSKSEPNIDAEKTSAQFEEYLETGATRCAVVFYRYDKSAGSRCEQCRNASKTITEDGPRCFRHVNKAGSSRCHYETEQEGVLAQCPTVAVSGTYRCNKHTGIDDQAGSSPSRAQKGKRRVSDLPAQKNGTTARTSSKRRSGDSQDADHRPSKTTRMTTRDVSGQRTEELVDPDTAERSLVRQSLTKSNPQVKIPVRKSEKQASTKRTRTAEEHDENVAESIESALPATSKSGKRTSSKTQPTDEGPPGTQFAKTTKSVGASGRTGSSDHDPSDEHEEPLEDAENGEDTVHEEETNVEETTDNVIRTPRSLKRAFKFLKLEKRSGRCKTDLCVSIKRVCDKTSSHLRDLEQPVEDTIENLADVRASMNRILEVEDDRAEAKEDMYGYVFRSLAKVLRSLYNDLVQRYDNIMDSLHAMRILQPFVRDVLALKDALDGWKVAVPQRYKGDKVVQDVITHLIVPLRQVESTFGKQLALLENKARRDQQLAKMHRQADEDDREMKRQDEAFVTTRKRWDRWQQLHITRMQCEPDPLRRKHLTIVKLEDVEERDANGDRFERLPVFTHRNAPSPHWAGSMAEGQAWSEPQEEALLEGLEAFAGKFDHRAQARIFADQSQAPAPFMTSLRSIVAPRAYCAPSALQRLSSRLASWSPTPRSCTRRMGGRNPAGSARFLYCHRNKCFVICTFPQIPNVRCTSLFPNNYFTSDSRPLSCFP
jgi:hypothetical protein